MQVAFQHALEKRLMGLPENPDGWLYAVAKDENIVIHNKLRSVSRGYPYNG